MKRFIVVPLLIAGLAGFASAKKKEEPPPPEAPTRNWLNLKDAVFTCSKDACAIDVTSLNLVSCNVQGCKSVTDIVMPTGPVLRQGVYVPPAPEAIPVPAAPAPKK